LTGKRKRRKEKRGEKIKINVNIRRAGRASEVEAKS
jgi:hypothetical protein